MNLETVVLNTVGTADGISINRSGKEQNSGDFGADKPTSRE